RVLEIGVGTGKNLHLYDPAVTAELVGIDFSPAMLAKAEGKPCRVPHTLLEMDAQHMAFPDASFDTVLATCVFCTVPDPVQGLKEARRVCKPGGRILLLEHMRVDRPVIGPLMDLVDPLVVWLIGTHINRRTLENVKLAGMKILQTENVHGDLMKLIIAEPAHGLS
ncbi:MAG TPA: class I SAM-dependent methyltransferase, partial [Symbiobacteriaceae bacterium]|nr:class I SAM-dependent methyltransferase [Symbiobacteriaceae bacterium]